MTPIIKENMTKLCSGAITADEFVSIFRRQESNQINTFKTFSMEYATVRWHRITLPPLLNSERIRNRFMLGGTGVKKIRGMIIVFLGTPAW